MQKVKRQCIWTLVWSFVRAESYKAVYLDMSVELCACRKL